MLCCVAGLVGTRNMSIKLTAILNCVFIQLIALFVLFYWLYYLREVEDLNNHLSVSSTIGLKLCEVPFDIDLKTTLPLLPRSRKNRTETIDCNLLLAVVFY